MPDEFPNPGLPSCDTQLERVEAIARMRGVAAQDVRQARVLELGCAGGASLLARAECRPESTFLGIDASPQAISQARETGAALALANVEFRQHDLGSLPADLGQFDYLLVERLYSRVEGDASAQLLAACRKHLAPRGVALVGYDAYPGWHILEMLRRMMFYEARGATTPGETVARGRVLLEFLKRSLLDERRPFDALVQAELDGLLQSDDAWLWREYLGPVRRPRYLRQFLDEARVHGLKYLGDCVVGIRYTDEMSVEIEQTLAEITSDPLQRDAYRDMLRNRPARLTLLCHDDLEFETELSAERLQGLWLEGRVRPENPGLSIHSTDADRFLSPQGASLTTKVPLVKAALVHLNAIWPRSIEVDELVAAARDRLGNENLFPSNDQDAARLRESLLQCAAARTIDLLGRPYPFVDRASERPLASPLARWQADRGVVVVNRKHSPLRLELVDQHVLVSLDGTRDRGQIVEQLVDFVLAGRLAVMHEGRNLLDRDRLREALEPAQARSLENLAYNAFLIR